MSWLKQSDIAADHPLVMRILEWKDYDDRLLNEMYGWVNRCATKSAAHDMDYIVEIGVARSMAFGRYEALRDAAVFCGIFFERVIQEEIKDDKGNVTGTQPRNVLKLVEEKDLFHMILRSEKEWEAQRQYDNRNPERSGPVRLRDGDECRWCGRITRWDSDRRSARMGTIDHLKPGDKNSTDEDRVVACKSCNSSRQEGESWDKPLRPVPTNPYYSAATAKWLFDKIGHRVEATEHRKETTNPVKPPAGAGQKAVEPPTRSEDPAKVSATGNAGAADAPKPATEQARKVESPGAQATRPARVTRSHSDLLAFPSVEAIEAEESSAAVEPPVRGEDPASAVEPPVRGEDPASAVEPPVRGEDQASAVEPPVRGEDPATDAAIDQTTVKDQHTEDPEPGQAAGDGRGPGARLNHGTDQAPIKQRSNTDQKPIKHRPIENQRQTTGESYVESGFAGSGRDGTGRAGSGRDGHAGVGSSAGTEPVSGSRSSRKRNRPRRRRGRG